MTPFTNGGTAMTANPNQKPVEKIWVCNTGEYEQNYTFGAWRSLEAAIAAVKAIYGPPYVVRWEEPTADKHGDVELTGHFEAERGYSTQHTDWFVFSEWDLDG